MECSLDLCQRLAANPGGDWWSRLHFRPLQNGMLLPLLVLCTLQAPLPAPVNKKSQPRKFGDNSVGPNLSFWWLLSLAKSQLRTDIDKLLTYVDALKRIAFRNVSQGPGSKDDST